MIEEYEHLDVIWAMDCIEKVGEELKEVLWKTCDVRDKVRIPKGCEDVDAWRDPKFEPKDEGVNGTDGADEKEEESQSSSDSRSESPN